MLKSPAGPSLARFTHVTYRNARWRCGVKGAKERENLVEERIDGKSRELAKARGSERQGENECAFSFKALPVQVNVSPFRSGHA